MTGYADPEELVGAWLRDLLGVKLWWDPTPPPNAWSTAAWCWLQRAPGGDDLALTLDDVLLDADVYAANADHGRKVANDIWSAMVLQLPKHTFDNGVFVTRSTCTTRPFWVPSQRGVHRSATYHVIMHGLI
jgi:hypothetical protein